MTTASGNLGAIDDDGDEIYYCGCHGTTFGVEDGICPACNDEWVRLEPDDPRYPGQEESDAG